jgi:GntR family transcriptional regulator
LGEFPLIKFDQSSGIPIYRQLVNYLRQQIIEGEYQVGDLLPSETELVQSLKISRTTVRLAFNELVKEKMIIRERGKGTIVTSKGITSKLSWLSSFSEEVIRLGMVPGTKFISVEVQPCPNKVARLLALEPGTSLKKVMRLRLADNQPIGLTTTWLNMVAFPQLSNIDFSKLSLYEVFEKELNLPIYRALEHVWADGITEYERIFLEGKVNDPALRISRVTYFRNAEGIESAIEYVEGVFCGKKYIVETELFR